MQANQTGKDTDNYWQEGEESLAGIKEFKDSYRVRFFTPTAWKIVSTEGPRKSVTGHDVVILKMIVDSSNKGGSPIRKTWEFGLIRISGEWKIRAITDTSK